MKKNLKFIWVIAGFIIVVGAVFLMIYFNKKDTKEISKNNEMIDEKIVGEKSDLKEYIKQIENITIKLNLQEGWNYEEIENSENPNAKFELKLYKEDKEKSASLFYNNDILGICGTGLEIKNLNLNNGNKISVGYYDKSKIWDFIAFGEPTPNIAIINYGLDENEANELLENINTIEIEKRESVSLKVINDSITSKGAKFTIKNNSQEEYTYGADYRIDKNENGVWKEAPLYAQLSWNEIAYILKANEETKEINIDWTIGYKELKPGKYRLVKKVFKSLDVPITKEEVIEIYGEFEIE